MNIGIVSPFNPSEFKDLFPQMQVPELNKTASSVHALVRSFIEAGHTVWVFTINNLSLQYNELISDKLKVILVPYRGFKGSGPFHIFDVIYLRKAIAKYLKQIDILHGQWTYQYSYAAIAFSNQIPVFCTVRDWCPYIMTLQNNLKYKFDWRLINYRMFKKIMQNEKVHLIANSHYTYDRIKGAYPYKEVNIIPNSIKKQYILVDDAKRSNADIRIITIAASVTDIRKNIIRLLEAFQLFRKKYFSASLIVVGKIDPETSIVKDWRNNGYLDNVELVGVIAHDKVISLLDSSTMMVHPALEETFGNTLLEAMARRVPVVGGEMSGAVPAVLGNGKYGICCDVTRSNEIFKAMVRLMDIEVADAYINRATNHLIMNYASDVVCANHIRLYNSFI